jgi:predicted component of type VI protein secretion system
VFIYILRCGKKERKTKITSHRGRTFIVFNVTFSNISAISWRTVLVVEEERTTDHGQTTGKLFHLRL